MNRAAGLVALIAATGISTVGSAMTLIVVPWFVLETTGSGAGTGLVAAAETLGLLLSVGLGGPLVDRFGARRMSVLGDLATLAMVAAIPLAYNTFGLSLAAIAVLGFGIGLGRAPSRTAKQVLLPHAVDRAGTTVARGASWLEAAMRSGDLLGAPIGGLLIAVIGAPSVLLVDAGCLGVAAVLTLLFLPRIEAGPAEAGGVRGYVAELVEGARRLAADRLLLACSMLCAATNALFVGLFSVLVPAYGTVVWRDSTVVGVVVAVVGAGGLAGALIYGWVGGGWSRRATFAGGFLLCGPPTFLVIGIDPPVWLLVPLLGIFALGNGTLNPVLAGVKYERVPEPVRGKVFGSMYALAVAVMPLGTMCAGLLLDAVGPREAVLVFGAAMLALTLCPLVFSFWRELDAKPGTATTSARLPADRSALPQ